MRLGGDSRAMTPEVNIMESFHSSAVALSIILGLAVARLLSSAVAAFKSRNRAKLTWMPFVWAGCIFLWQLQYWWAIIELPRVINIWTLGAFMVLVSLALLLFVSASLILPSSELGEHDDRNELFEHNGQWALVSLSLYFGTAIFADWLLWNMSPLSTPGAFNIALFVLPLVFVLSRSKRVQEAITLLYVPLSVWAALILSPASY